MKKSEIGGQNLRTQSLFNNKGDDSILNILPYKRCSPNGVVVKNDNTVQAYLAVNTTDLQSMNDDELARWCDSLTNLTRVYSYCLKLISMSRRTSVPDQISYWTSQKRIADRAIARKQSVYQNQVISTINRATLQKLYTLQRQSSELKFYFMVSAKDKKELAKRIRSIQVLGGDRGSSKLGLAMQNKKEVTAILFRMNNMNDEGDSDD